MNIEKTVNKYLYKSSVGNLPTDKQGNPIPALLFANAKNDDRFGDLYLFNNFGYPSGVKKGINLVETPQHIRQYVALK